MPAHILIVEDEHEVAGLIELILKRSKGYRVTTALSGADAMRYIQNDPPDLVLLDLAMPGVDGIDVMQHLRQNPATQHIPIVIVTARKDMLQAILRYRPEATFLKPIRPNDLLNAIKNLV